MDNRDRLFFVTREMTARIMEACPNAEWRAIIALCRFGGLRCPSELLTLTWQDILWDRNRFQVSSPKLEHAKSMGKRWVPLFPELRPYLEALYDQAEAGTVYVINRTRNGGVNLRTQFKRIIHRAGLTPWERLFQNLRTSRETELAEEYPLHIATEWIGNSVAVAAKHYLQVTEEHFEKAAQATQNPTQYGAESSRGQSQGVVEVAGKAANLRGSAENGDEPIPPAGRETSCRSGHPPSGRRCTALRRSRQ
jgi:integrase